LQSSVTNYGCADIIAFSFTGIAKRNDERIKGLKVQEEENGKEGRGEKRKVSN